MSDLWVYRRQPLPTARLRLFCLPYAGGGSAIYSRWQADFPVDVEVCAVELPGRRTRLREPLIRRAGPLVEAIARGVAPHLDLPFAVFGHSMGAVLAFELARHLRRAALPVPRALYLSGAPAPHLRATRPPLWNLPDPAFLAALRRYGGTPESVLAEPALMAHFLPLLRADFEVLDTYVYEPGAPLDRPVAVFGGERDPHATLPQLTAWGDLVAHPVPVRLFPGGHFYLQDERTSLTSAIARDLTRFLGPA